MNLNQLYEHHPWLKQSQIKIDDQINYLKITISDQNHQPISQIVTTINDLDQDPCCISNVLNLCAQQPIKTDDLIDLDKLNPLTNQDHLKQVKIPLQLLLNQYQLETRFKQHQFYQLDPKHLVIVTSDLKLTYELKTPVITMIDCTSDQRIQNNLLNHIKKLVALHEINQHYDFYLRQLIKQDKINQSQRQLVKQISQNSCFSVQLNQIGQAEVAHYYNDKVFVNYQWLLNYDYQKQTFSPVNTVIANLAFYEDFTNAINNLQATLKPKPTLGV